MNDNKSPSFSINDYDDEGDIYSKGVFLHFGDTRLKIGSSVDDLKELAASILRSAAEIEENNLL